MSVHVCLWEMHIFAAKNELSMKDWREEIDAGLERGKSEKRARKERVALVVSVHRARQRSWVPWEGAMDV